MKYSILLIFCYLATILSAAFWMGRSTIQEGSNLYLCKRKQVLGYTFSEVRLGPSVAAILNATTCLNGDFLDLCSNRVSVLFCDWSPGSSDITSLMHTPDACWKSQGFVQTRYGEPSEVFLRLGGNN